jgi:hypothetical protein
MCYGASDSGKSTQASYIAEYIHRVYGKKTRLIALDRGSLWAPSQEQVAKGITIPLEVPTSHEFNPFAIMRKLRRGEWPEGGKINMPTRVEDKSGVCYVTNTKWLPWTEKETEEIGAIIVDSLTSFATTFMSDVKQKNQRSGDPASQPRTEDGEQMGTNTQSHYGDCHTEVLDLLQSFQSLPVHVTMFTALEGKGEDDDSGIKRTALGPETVGKAINGKLPSRVNHCFHLQAVGAGKSKVVKAWYNRHPSDIPKVDWPSKTTLPPARLKELWARWPNGYIPLSLENGIGEFLEFLDNGKEK